MNMSDHIQTTTRRAVLGMTVAAAAGLTALAMPGMAKAAVRLSTPRGPGAVSGAPYLPPGFRNTFKSRFIEANGVRLHAVIGGKGPPLLLIHGWPQTWYQWRLVMPALSRDYTVVAVDQRGVGLSDKPETGYDVATQANDMVGLMEALGYRRFAVIGFDVGMPIGHALAADHPEHVERLVVGEAIITGVSQSPPFSPGALNRRTWHIAFNRLGADVNEALVRGREHIYFSSEYAVSAGTPLPKEVVRYYVERLASSPDALRGSFGSYRAIDENYVQNQERKNHRLSIPVLAIGGGKSIGQGVANTMRQVADNVEGRVIQESGHWLAEEAPEQVLAAVTPFLAPYRSAELARLNASVRSADLSL
jgi:pimeloyl-ACP methyl ester carboxylesterase